MVIRASAADRAQRKALDPAASVWVAASAGTGKTRVLTERLLALMLNGTDPLRILCLTFTRAAAAEMANRVNERLAAWTTLLPGALAEELEALTGHNPEPDEMARARQLFARILDVPGGARIATIHAFCQSLLRRFPLEAQVPPEFAVIDERSAREALAEAGEAVLAAARAGAAAGLAEALDVVARYAPEERFAELMQALAQDRGKLRAALADGESALDERLCEALSIAPAATPDRLRAHFCAPGAGDEAGLRAAAAALAQASVEEDRARGLAIARWCDDAIGRLEQIEDYLAAFLTQRGEIRRRLVTNAAAAPPGSSAGVLLIEAERVLRFRTAHSSAALREATGALARLGDALLQAYEHRKRLQGVLDYDDLIFAALALLRRPGIAPWVLFKLDGGIDHILIDEAQDTNPEQWGVVAALAEEFFAGEGARERDRTVFAVGDAKQSIYSFQRADPEAFERMRRHFQDRVTAAHKDWRIVPLEISFRATEPLLRAVDAVFAHDTAADGVALDGRHIRHVAHREGHGGIVELWPPVVPPPEEPVDHAALWVTRRGPAEPHARLARGVAGTIKKWLADGERLGARGRPMRPGDIMVLVRRRNDFVPELLRALKQSGVPVAGADRLMLTKQLAVEDLIALGRFLLFPEDDLTLAAVLKGPLFDLSEEALFLLAYGRGRESLWGRLRHQAGDNPVFARAADRLGALLARADFVPPHELYAEILGAEGGRQAMLERLGAEAADPIEEFLALALAYEHERVPSLQGFLHWLVTGDIEVKRDFGERQRDEVRILTVHGAKGLEAPVVFLPDTMQLPDYPPALLWSDNEGLPLWRPRADLSAALYADERAAFRRRQLQEYRRLLYVALTRAQDRLYVCGWETRRPVSEAASWYTLCQAGWSGLATAQPFDTKPLIGELDGWAGDTLRIEGPQRVAPVRDRPLAAATLPGRLPRWALAPPAPDPQPPKPLIPSRPSGGEPATLSPLAAAGRDRFKRGLLIHRLLQSLPELAAAERAAAARRFLALPVHGLSPEERDEICHETLAVIGDPAFAELWGPDAQAEVPVVGLIPGSSPGTAHALSGQIDRLVVTPERVLIVDYKTLRPPPETEAEVPAVYLEQLASYRAALARIYPGRRIECALLWTEAPRLMPISPARLAAAAPRQPA